MQNSITSSRAIHFLKENWFKVTIFAILLFVLLRKDFSFNLNLNTPARIEQSAPKSKSPKQQIVKQKKKESLLTEHKETKKTSILDRFDLPFFGKKKKEEPQINKIDSRTKIAYLKRFLHVAKSERKKYNIPSSIILANALLHSDAGQNTLSFSANNHFKIACKNNWEGETASLSNQCFRKYENAWASFRDHSLFITTGAFAHLKQLPSDDYKAWAKGLEKAGYSSYNNLSKRLINIIEEFDLQQYDND